MWEHSEKGLGPNPNEKQNYDFLKSVHYKIFLFSHRYTSFYTIRSSTPYINQTGWISDFSEMRKILSFGRRMPPTSFILEILLFKFMIFDYLSVFASYF